MIALYVLGAIAVLPPVVMAAILVAALSPGPECPACGDDTVLVRIPLIGRRLPWIERRWCIDCDWQGLTRRARHGRRPVPIRESRTPDRV